MISNRKNISRKISSFAFNLIVIVSLLVSQVNLVKAQDATPIPTETPTEVVTLTPEPIELPTATEEPTATEVPTVEPTLTLVPTEVITEAASELQAISEFSWELSYEYSNSIDPLDAKVTALNNLGLVVNIESLVNGNHSLAISGKGSTDLIRQVIYEILLPEINLLSDAALISIKTDSIIGSPIVVNLESQPTTGYAWQLNTTDNSTFTMQGNPTFENRFDGPGTTALQTLTINPSITGQSTLEILYKRPFDVDPVITRYLSIVIPGSVTSIDLSDPNPPAYIDTKPSDDDLSDQSDDLEAQSFTTSTLPTSFDWRTTGKVSDIRNQGGCGSCWAFGTTAVLESALRINKNISEDLSEQFLVSCNIASKNDQCSNHKYSCAWGGCEDAHDYHVDTLGEGQTGIGAVLESVLPYTEADTACPANLTHAYVASSWHYVSSSYTPTVEKIKRAIYAYGPVTTRVCTGTNFGSYTSGVLTTTDGTCSNHVVAIVGWNDATQSWIVRNSWGTNYGESGYVNIQWGISNIGSLSTYMTMPVTTTLPVSVSPENGATTSTQPTFTWNAVTGAIGYRLRISNATTGMVDVEEAVSTSYCSGSPSVCTYTLQGNLKGTNEKWDVAVAGQDTFSSAKTFSVTNPLPSNDSPTGAITMTLGELQALELGSSFTVSSEDPINVRDSEDLASAWYSFTPSTTGVYTLNAYGSDFSPNLTVLKKVSATSRTLAVYSETGSGTGEDYYKVSFTGIAGTTYLIDVSSAEGGSLNLVVNQETCPSGNICGAAVEGDGHVMNYPSLSIYYSSGGYAGYGSGTYSGFISGNLYNSFSGPYTIITKGDYSMVVNSNVTSTIFSPNGIGLAKVSITVKDDHGTEIYTDNIAVANSSDRNIGTYLPGTQVGKPGNYYLPAGSYNFFASNSDAGIEIYNKNITVPSTLVMDASSPALKIDTIKFRQTSSTDSDAWIYSPDNYGPYLRIDGDKEILFAAPAGTVISHMDYVFYQHDASNNYWNYHLNLKDDSFTITGGATHLFTIGDTFTVAPEVMGSPFISGNGTASIYPGVTDGLGNSLSYLNYSTSSGSGTPSEGTDAFAAKIEALTTVTGDDGRVYQKYLPNLDELVAQSDVQILPSYTVTDSNMGSTTLSPQYNYFSNPALYSFTSASPIGTYNVLESINLGPYDSSGVKTGSTDFEVLSAPPGADLIPNAIPMTLNTQYTNSTTEATISTPTDPSAPGYNATLADPVNVCNEGDISSIDGGSVWYSFTAPSSGIFTLNAGGSDYNANLTVVKRVSTTSRTAVICTETDTEKQNTDLSFSAVSGSTYLIGASSSTGGGNLSLNIRKETCYTDDLCGVGIEGDGRAMHWPNSIVTNSSGNRVGSGYGNYSGFNQVYLWGGYSNGTYTVSTNGAYSLTSTSSAIPGTYAPSAVGLAKTIVTSKDTTGNETSTDSLAITNSARREIYAHLGGDSAGSTRGYYLPAGNYNLSVSGTTEPLFIYKPNITVSSTSSTVTLDASVLPQDDFNFELHGITDLESVTLNTPDFVGTSFSLPEEKTITIAAPTGTRIPSVEYSINLLDSSNLNWRYYFNIPNEFYILGGQSHNLQVGGAIKVEPYSEQNPLVRFDGSGYLRPGVSDNYGNSLNYVEYYGDLGSGSLPQGSNAQGLLNEAFSSFTDGQGITFYRPTQKVSDINDQEWVSETVYPTYTVSNDSATFITTPIYEYFSNPAYFDISTSSPLGTWNIVESVDLGPLTGGIVTGTGSFDVIDPVSNDLITGAIPIEITTPENPHTYTQDTRGATISYSGESSTLVDPINVCNEWDYYSGTGGSVWYSFVAPSTGFYTLSIEGSDYNPNLSVLKRVSSTSRTPVVCSDTYLPNGNVRMSFSAVAGTTYLIDVSKENGGGNLSLKINQETCQDGHMCGVGVEGDGRVMHWPNVGIYNANGDQIGGANNSYSGFIDGFLWDGNPTGTYKIITSGSYSLVSDTRDVPGTGSYSPTAIGLPATSIIVKDTSGTQIETQQTVIVSTLNNRLYGYFWGTTSEWPRNYYLPASTYSISAASQLLNLEVYKPVNVVSTSASTVTLDASASGMVEDTFVFNKHGFTDGYGIVNNPQYFGLDMPLSVDHPITFSAPAGTLIPNVAYRSIQNDTADLRWEYLFSVKDSATQITGGVTYTYDVGGELSIAPYVDGPDGDAPISLGEKEGYLHGGIYDFYENELTQVNYSGEVAGSGSSGSVISSQTYTVDGQEFNVDSTTLPGGEDDLSAQEWIWSNSDPNFTLKDSNGNEVWYHRPQNQLGVFNFDPFSPLGIWTLDVTIDLGPNGGEKSGSTTFEVIAPAATNDDMANAIPMTLDELYILDSTTATIDADDLVSVCNAKENESLSNPDAGSVWFSFTAPTTGNYYLASEGNTYDPNLSVFKKTGATTGTPVICTETEAPFNVYLSFYAVANTTYWIDASTLTGGGKLSLSVHNATCPSGSICGVAIEGDGRVMHWPEVRILNSNGDQVGQNTDNFFSGFVMAHLNDGVANGTYKVLTKGTYSLAVNTMPVPGSGIFLPTAVGMPAVSAIVKNESGDQIATDTMIVVNASNTNQGYDFSGTFADSERKYYLPAGTYNFLASSSNDAFEVYQPEFVVPTGTSTITLDASASTMVEDTFSFTLDGISKGFALINVSGDHNAGLQLDTTGIVTFSAPAGTSIPLVNYMINENDEDELTWRYFMGMKNSRTSITGGVNHSYTVGGDLTIIPDIVNDPVRLDEPEMLIRPGIKDAHGNTLDYFYYDGDISSDSITEGSLDQGFMTQKLITLTAEDGTLYQQNIRLTDDLSAQDWVYAEPYPTYTITGQDGIVDTVTPPDNKYYNWVSFELDPDRTAGTWNISESIDLGPYGGDLRVGDSTFLVVEVGVAPDNDLISGAISITEAMHTQNTGGSTLTASDPSMAGVINWHYDVFPNGMGSVWYKYIATKDGFVTLDTIGSDYDTAMAVYKGTPSIINRIAHNDDISTPDNIPSQVSFSVVSGSTYYVQIVDTGMKVFKDEEAGAIGSASIGAGEPTVIPSSDVLIQQIGGNLTLNYSLTECYSLTTTTSTGGTVAVSPAPNCVIGTKKLYSEDTEITVTATHSTNYGLLNWTGSLEPMPTTNPLVFTIDENTTLKSNFVLLAAPVLTAPATATLTNNNTPTFTWNAVNYGDTYEIQIDNLSTFAAPIEQTQNDLDLSYTGTTTLTDGLKYWRVRTINDRGEPGTWSATRTLTVDTIAPAAPTSFTPVNDAWVRGVPTYTWNAPATANAYIFEYASDADFITDVFTTGVLTAANYKPVTQEPGIYFWHVQARDAAGNWSDFSAPQKVTIMAPIPGAPALVSPTSGIQLNDTTPELDWNAVQFGEEYQVQMSKVSNFATTVYDETMTELFANSTTSGDGTYYWRVRAINNVGETGAWSAIRNFILDTSAPAVPTMKLPANNTYVTTPLPKFTVETVTGTKYYHFQVSDIDDFSSTLINVSPTTPYYQVTAANILPMGMLYWRMSSIDAAGNESAWSVVYHFTVTIQKTPANASFTTNPRPPFTWTAYPGATAYHLYLKDDADAAVWDVALAKTTTTYTPTLTQQLPVGKYRWNLEVTTNSGTVTTDFLVFNVSTAPPAAPVLLTPATGFLTNTSNPTFTWSPATNADKYDLQISKISTFATIADALDDLDVTTYTPVLALPDGLLYWRVRSKNVDGNPGQWSSARTITVDTDEPDIPVVISPVQDSIVNTYLPKLTAGAVAGTKTYVFEVCNDPVCSDIRFSKITTVPYYTLVSAQALGIGGYYWRVQAVDAALYESGWSDVTLFQVTNQKAPANGLVITTATTTRPVFTWATMTGATGYDLEVRKNPTDAGDPNTGELILDRNDLTTTSFSVPVGSELGPGVYYWYLTMHTSGSSPSTGWYRFTVSPAALKAPVLTSPVAGSFTNEPDVNFAWNTVTGADHYEFQSGVSSAFTGSMILSVGGNDSLAHFSNDGMYYWRVRTVNEFGVAGAWSAAKNFTLDTHKQAAPVLSTPLNNAIVNTQTPTLAIKSVTGATSYLYEVDDDIAFGSVNVTGTSTKTSFVVPTGQKLAYGKYYWRVASIDKAGNQSNWSESEIRSLIVTNQKTPANGSYTTNARQPFTWVAVPGATGYEIEFCVDSDCLAELNTYTVGVTTTYTPTVADSLADGVYYWRMHALTAGDPGLWTPIFTFTKIH